MGIINYEKLEEPIKVIEDILNVYDNEEKALILRHLNQRFNAINQKRKVNEGIQHLDLKSLMKKAMGGGE